MLGGNQAKPKRKFETLWSNPNADLGQAAINIEKREGMKFLLGLIAVLIVFSQLSKCGGSTKVAESVEEKRQRESAAALNHAFGLCRKAILTISRDPEKSEVPYIFPVVENGNWVWSWRQQTKMLRVRNGLGLKVAATGLCAVDRETVHIEMLIVDDKIVLSPTSK